MGDHVMKGEGKNFISNEIEFQMQEITDKNPFLILACDGVRLFNESTCD